jgi:hypothetical protein
LTIVLVGGGPRAWKLRRTGGTKNLLPKDYPAIDFSEMKNLIEGNTRLLAAMSEKAGATNVILKNGC